VQVLPARDAHHDVPRRGRHAPHGLRAGRSQQLVEVTGHRVVGEGCVVHFAEGEKGGAHRLRIFRAVVARARRHSAGGGVRGFQTRSTRARHDGEDARWLPDRLQAPPRAPQPPRCPRPELSGARFPRSVPSRRAGESTLMIEQSSKQSKKSRVPINGSYRRFPASSRALPRTLTRAHHAVRPQVGPAPRRELAARGRTRRPQA